MRTVPMQDGGRHAQVPPSPRTLDAWAQLPELTLDEHRLSRTHVITANRDHPSHAAFDVLRTRLMQALAARGWKRVAVTAPTRGCGATFTAANLAVSLARQETCRTVLLDLDMRAPSLHQTLGVAPNTQAGAFLRGELAPEHHLIRLGQDQFHTRRNLAFGFNAAPESYPAETLQDPRARAALEALEARFRPDVMLFDLPPVLDNDDVIAMRPLFDGVLLVLGGGITTERQVKEVERRLGEQTPLLGMILNKAEGVTPGA